MLKCKAQKKKEKKTREHWKERTSNSLIHVNLHEQKVKKAKKQTKKQKRTESIETEAGRKRIRHE